MYSDERGMKAKLLGAVVILIVVGLGLFGWVGYQLFTTGFSAKTEPHALEVLDGAADPPLGDSD